MSYIKTHEELLKLHGKKVSCEIDDTKIKNGKICVEGDCVFICQNLEDGLVCKDKLGYKYSWLVSRNEGKYEKDSRYCKNIKLIDETSEERIESVEPKIKIQAAKIWDNFNKTHNKLLDYALILNLTELNKLEKQINKLMEK